ncbi:hypothetical protein [Methylobacterium sp. B4]|uniref:hypothetical protein n=1 Tax=Methylobacterium sp. B4 TaxID=1938755 RepID=UPI000D769076|nr:hypothetical protein [Methylobacterium sp. B4]PXW57731.1 hypothetical protein BY998_1138 [Methylobacterium sp. B4]
MVKGEHPHLGVVVAMQMMDDAIFITTTVPFTDRANRHAAEQYDAIRLAINELMPRWRRSKRTA